MTSNLMKPILSMLLLVVSVVSLFSGCTNESMNSTTTVAPDLSTQGATETTAPVLFSDVDNVDVPSDAYYKNKLAINAPDPFILKYGDTYYLYNTGTALLTVRTSKDLVNWSSSKVIFSVTNTSWALTYCWPLKYIIIMISFISSTAQNHRWIASITIAVLQSVTLPMELLCLSATNR